MTPLLSDEPILTVRAELADLLSFGPTPYGDRRVINILGGTVTGRLSGTILPGGADWQFIRADGVADITARYTIKSDAGALVLVESKGLRHGPPDVIAKLAAGEAVDPALYYFRTVMRFETGAPDLAWMNRILALAHGTREARAVRLAVYEVL